MKTLNETGATALPGGYLSSAPGFYGIGIGGFWWCKPVADSMWARSMGNDIIDVKRFSLYKVSGLSVRCIKD
jgi:hypothetical protein